MPDWRTETNSSASGIKLFRISPKPSAVLKAAVGNGNFADEQQVTELARLHTENARTMLNLHREEHGC